LLGLGAVHDDDTVEVAREAGLDGQGRLNDEDPRPAAGLPRELPDGLFVLGQDEGVDEPVEEAAGGGIGENDAAQAGPVDRPVGPQDVSAEAVDDSLPDGPAGTHEVVGRDVGGAHDTAFFGQDSGNDRLAGGDSSGQGDAQDPIFSSWRSS
jgi:hypothetical protein